MLCEKCNKNNATVHIVKVVSGNKQQLMLCEKCANMISDIPLSSSLEEFDNFGFQKLISGLVGYMNSAKGNVDSSEIKCTSCGTTYKEFKSSGILGCSECYNVFSSTINPVIKRVQVDLEHIGKVPKKFGKYFAQKRKITKLKEELQKAVLVEEYERAAEIRDEIKILSELVNGGKGNE